MPIANETLETKEEAAQLAREKAELEEINLLVTREENEWLKYTSEVK